MFLSRIALLMYLIISAQSSFSQCINTVSNLVSWWDADNVVLDSAKDIRGGEHGKMMNGAYIDSGFVCSSIYFDGIDDYLLIQDSDSLSFGNGTSDRSFSIECWLNPEQVYETGIFAKGSNYSREYIFRITGTDPDHLALGIYDDGRSNGGQLNAIGRRSNLTLSAYANSWIHVAATYDGSGISSGIKLYLNGVELSTWVLAGTDSIGYNYTAMRNQNEAAVMGKFFHDGTIYSNGRIDELTVYSKELTASEILAIYSASSAGKCSSNLDDDTTNCHNNTLTDLGDDLGVSIADMNLLVYPNPSVNGNFTVEWKGLNVSELNIFNHAGQLVHSEQIAKNLEMKNFEIHGPKGIYLISLKTPNSVVTRTLIVQ